MRLVPATSHHVELAVRTGDSAVVSEISESVACGVILSGEGVLSLQWGGWCRNYKEEAQSVQKAILSRAVPEQHGKSCVGGSSGDEDSLCTTEITGHIETL